MVPLDFLIILFAIIREIQDWCHPADTDSLLNILGVVVPLCMELAMVVMLFRVACALKYFIATTALEIFTFASSEKNDGVPRLGIGASAGLSMSQRSVETLTLIPIFKGI